MFWFAFHKRSKGLRVILFFLVSTLSLSAGIHEKIDKLILAEEFEKAETIARKAYEKHPDDPATICALACVYRNQARESGINVNTDAMGIKDGEGGTYEISGKDDLESLFQEQLFINPEIWKKSEVLYNKIIEIDPTYGNAYFNLINDYLEMPDFERYFDTVERYIAGMGVNEETISALQELSHTLFNKGILNQADRLLERITQLDATYAYAWSDRGTVRIKQGKMDESIPFLRKAYGLDPVDPINLENYVSALIYTEDFKQAYQVMETSLTRDPDQMGFNMRLGMISIILGRDPDPYFSRYVEQARKSNKDGSFDVWIQLAETMMDLPAQAKEDQIGFLEDLLNQTYSAEMDIYALFFSNILETIDFTDYALMMRAAVYDRLNDAKTTLEYLDQISIRRSVSPEIMSEKFLHNNYAINHINLDQYREALPHTQAMLNLDANSLAGHYYMGLCYLELDERQKGVEHLKIVAASDDKDNIFYINNAIRTLNSLD